LVLGAVLLLVATLISACNPTLERQYYREGVGTAIQNPDVITVTELQNAYLQELCRQAGPSASSPCEPAGFSPAWGMIVQAGMNDIDARCDAYLAWLDDKRRSYGPIVSEINSLNTAAQSIMRVTGVGANPITLVGIAFGLASDTFTNIRARLLLEVNHSTVQSIVLSRQQAYREGINKQVIDNRAAAVYALRSYLRQCMPMTIETQINSTVTIYEQSGADALKGKPLIDPKTVGGVALLASEPVKKPERAPMSTLSPEVAALFARPDSISPSRFRDIQIALCVPSNEMGQAGDYTKGAITILEASYLRSTKDSKLNSDEIDEILGQGRCIKDRGRNYFEKRTFDDSSLGTQPLVELVDALNKAQPDKPLSRDIKTIGEARAKIKAVRALPNIQAQLRLRLPAAFVDQVTPDFFAALP
jgi:hypothetical protein